MHYFFVFIFTNTHRTSPPVIHTGHHCPVSAKKALVVQRTEWKLMLKEERGQKEERSVDRRNKRERRDASEP